METKPCRPLRSPALALGYGVLLSSLSAGLLVWLLWKCVPLYAGMFEAMGMSVPNSTRLVFAASRWMARLLPVFVLGGLLATPPVVALGVVLGRRYGAEVVLEIAAGVMLTVALALTLATSFTVVALQAPFQHVLQAAAERTTNPPAPPARPTP